MKLAGAAAVLVTLVSASAAAHGLRPGVLTLVEEGAGVFVLAWAEPVDTSEASASIEIVLPEPCRPNAVVQPTTGMRVDCGPEGMHGAIELRGLTGGRVAALVRFADGRVIEALVDEDVPRLELARPSAGTAAAWVRSGVEHILVGLDHIAFVLGLLLVVGTRSVRRLVATITAFTLAHSITLALAATGTLVLASAPVEATIAASVVLVARESTHDRPTLTRRAPWAVAFVFGLVHGLGFAGALASSGLPPGWGLVGFNVGVELGQLAIVLASVGLVRLLGERRTRPLRLPVTYAIGGLAAFWLLQRALAIV